MANFFGVIIMRLRKQELGDRNIIGARVEMKRKELGMKQKDFLARLQVEGMDINASALSKLEGQVRGGFDYELVIIARVLGVSLDWLLCQ